MTCILLFTFGYRVTGVPQGVDYVVDCRGLRNPGANRGTDTEKRDEVRSNPATARLVEDASAAILHKQCRFVGVGCSWGRHRSVVVAEMLADRLTEHDVIIIHLA